MAINLFKAPTSNFGSTSLNGAINDSVQTITLNSTSGLQAPGYLVIDRQDANGTNTPNAREVIKYTGISGSDLTGVTRAADGSTARSHSDGALVEPTLTIGMWNDQQDFLAVSLATVDGSLRPLSTASIVNLTGTKLFYSAVTLTNLTITNSALASGASIVGFFPSAASGAVLTSRGNSITPVFSSPNPSPDGWTASSDTWVFASASTFTIAGVDRTSVYTKGTRLKFTQTSAKYAVVVSSSFSTDTTVTIAVNTDYTIANAAITSPNYSYQFSPQGYPGWFSFSTTWGGFSSDPTGVTFKYRIDGNICYVNLQTSGTGTSNATTLTFTVPVAPAISNFLMAWARGFDNGAHQSTPAQLQSTATNVTISAYKANYQTAWTGSGEKTVTAQFFYEF